ncbi:collagen-like protein [Microbacterium saperdae]|uniref:Collagen triple helix repeat protein n=1 Tax=Microbacterium saperdae TaxID=69368 RepID=A0A543BQW7_9MICO|nr:collagen-like protein [Microbacterium saperdae]TQL87200.1 collagen triple helix repeat protein [Microbacterium saperdae]GGM42138.1 hypothetical protein GCM10010489_11500 [Microbacterium saperdae]
MTDTEALLSASVRERRRLVLVFSVLLALVTGALTLGWVGAWNGREAWHEQAMTWQDRYVELYDEFTVATGEEPDAPEPSIVANQGPQGEPGQPGPPGTVGPAGKDGGRGLPGEAGEPGAAGDKGDAGEPGQPGTTGTQGATGTQGPVGPTGPQGATGAQGPEGPAGPTCPDGYTATLAWVAISDSEFDIPRQQQALVCIPTPSGEIP